MSKFQTQSNLFYFCRALPVFSALFFANVLMAQTPLESLPQTKPIEVQSKPLKVRLKDITEFEGVRSHALSGYGLVIGLAGTGDDNPGTKTALLNYLENNTDLINQQGRAQFISQLNTKNMAYVYVTANLPPFASIGQKVDVGVSIFDNSSNLNGGRLLPTPLRGADGELYAVAGGKLSVGGFAEQGKSASVRQNVVHSGQISNGAVIEEVLCQDKVGVDGFVNMRLRNEDRATAIAVMNAINSRFPNKAEILNPQTIKVYVPVRQTQNDLESFLAKVQEIEVVPDTRAKVIVNEHSGTIVITENVVLRSVAINYGSITISTSESANVSQPNALSPGNTEVIPQTNIAVDENTGPFQVVPRTNTLKELVDGLNTLGLSAREMGLILQEINKSGALQAELIFQ